jgi:hypothetical protein
VLKHFPPGEREVDPDMTVWDSCVLVCESEPAHSVSELHRLESGTSSMTRPRRTATRGTVSSRL